MAAGAALALSLAAPGIAPGFGPLVLPGLSALYLLLAVPRAAWLCYLVGAIHLGVFSWSVRHVLFAAWVGIAVVGGGYFAVLPAWVRGLHGLRCPRALAFGAAIAGSSWLRAYMPDITYPHAQPAHALYEWPSVLAGVVALGGEPLANFVLAALAAGVADACTRARRRAALGVIFCLLGLAAVARLRWAPPAAVRSVAVAIVQPGTMPWRTRAALAAWQQTHLVRPTVAVAGRQVAAPPALVVWPESASFVDVSPADGAGSGGGDGRLVGAPEWLVASPLPLAAGTELLLGGRIADGPHEGVAAAVLVDARGALLGYQQKVRLVPGGERQPFLGWLPDAWSDALQRGLAAAIGAAPHLRPAGQRPPLPVADGVRIGSLHCFDNAFADVARAYVDAGANLLVVLSNEMWYQGGAELEQMVAMSVFRALETGVPVVRCTIDGDSVTVAQDGQIEARLPRGAAEVQTVVVHLPERGGPVAPAAPAMAAVCALSLVFAIAHGLLAWVRLRRPFRGPKPPAAVVNMPAVGA